MRKDDIDKNTLWAESWIDLQEFFFNEREEDKDRWRSSFAYRGVSSCDYKLETSIQRLNRIPSKFEGHLIRSFQKYSPLNTLVDDYNNIWNWLSLGQHHGLPTRFLDWSFSPNVALHFMCEELEHYDKDGAIWMIDFVNARDVLPDKVQRLLKDKSHLCFTSMELKRYIGDDIESINDFQKIHGNFLMFLEPPSIDERIINQFACFSFMLNPDVYLHDWLGSYQHLYKKIIIPKELKWEIRDKLDQANISERIIYPGLDGISKWLKRYYRRK